MLLVICIDFILEEFSCIVVGSLQSTSYSTVALNLHKPVNCVNTNKKSLVFLSVKGLRKC